MPAHNPTDRISLGAIAASYGVPVQHITGARIYHGFPATVGMSITEIFFDTEAVHSWWLRKGNRICPVAQSKNFAST